MFALACSFRSRVRFNFNLKVGLFFALLFACYFPRTLSIACSCACSFSFTCLLWLIKLSKAAQTMPNTPPGSHFVRLHVRVRGRFRLQLRFRFRLGIHYAFDKVFA